MRFCFITILFFAYFTASIAHSDTFHRTFYQAEEHTSNNHRGYLEPSQRPEGVHPFLIAATQEVHVMVGETVLVPIFSRSSSGYPVPIRWSINNKQRRVVGTTIDKARPYSLHGNTYSSVGFRGSIPSQIAGPLQTSPVQDGLGCERRRYLKNKRYFFDGQYDNQSGNPTKWDSIFVCIHGRQEGETTVFVGEHDPNFEFNRKDPKYKPVGRPSYLSEMNRLSIKVKVVERKHERRPREQELAMVEVVSDGCNTTHCTFMAKPLNRGGEVINCMEPELVLNWIYPQPSYELIDQIGCKISLKPKRLPSNHFPAFPIDFEVTLVAQQFDERKYESGTTNFTIGVQDISQSTSTVYVHPVNNQQTEDVKWARALCPAVISQGDVFSCLISVVNDTGNPPGPFKIDPNKWQLPKGITFKGFSVSSDNYPCFEVDPSVPNGAMPGIAGALDNGIRFYSAKFAISEEHGLFLTDAPTDCPK